MALKLKYTDEHGILHINMSPSSTPKVEPAEEPPKSDLKDPAFDTINNRFGQYDLFGGKYDLPSDLSGGEEERSLFRSRYNSVEEELANTPYAFATDRRSNFDITINRDLSPSKDIEDDRFFNRNFEYSSDLFGPELDFQVKTTDDTPAFTVTQLIHAQDRYFDLSTRQNKTSDVTSTVQSLTKKFEARSAPGSSKNRTVKIVESISVKNNSDKDDAFTVLGEKPVKAVQQVELTTPTLPVVPTSKRKRESSFAIIAEAPVSRPSSPRSLPTETRTGRISPFKGRGFREETSRHTTPKTSANNSRANSPPRRRTSSLSKIDKMAQVAPMPPPIHVSRPHSPRNFVRENIEGIRELSEFNREKHEIEAEKKRREEEEALLKEMGLLENNNKSRTSSRTNSPGKKLRSRSNSPAAILHYETLPADVNGNVGNENKKPVLHKSRVRSVSRSQPQSNNGSPQHSKIPKRQNSVSPTRKEVKKPFQNNSTLNKNQRFISNSTSSIHETIKIGSSVHDRRQMSKSTQNLNISPAHIKNKPPISPGRGGPPPSNKAINPKRLSPIVGTPNKSPVEDVKTNGAKTTKPIPSVRKPISTTSTSRLNSRQPSRGTSRDTSPDKRKTTNIAKTPVNKVQTKPVNRTPSSRATKPNVNNKPEVKKPITRTSSVKSIPRVPSTKNLSEKPPLKKNDSKKEFKEKYQSTPKVNEAGATKSNNNENKKMEEPKNNKEQKDEKSTSVNPTTNSSGTSTEITDEVTKQDNETQYDKIMNENGELVIMTKKNVVSMTTAAIASQPLEVVTTVTNQLPAALEKAREKGMFERHSSKDSLAPKNEDKVESADTEKPIEEKKPVKKGTIFTDDNIKLKPLQPPYNNPQVERVKQKIDDILKAPEVSPENILAAATAEVKEAKNSFKNLADKTKNDLKQSKDDAANKLTDLKDQVVKQNAKMAEDIRSEATKIVNSIITPVEEPKDMASDETKKNIEPIVMVVNERKKNGPNKSDIVEKMTETLVRGDAEVEVQSSNVSTPGMDKMTMKNKMADGGSDLSSQSNGGFPQSTSTTPKPPARQNRGKISPQNEESKMESKESTPDSQQSKKENICKKFLGKCARGTKCCACCMKPEDDETEIVKSFVEVVDEKKGFMSKMNCFKKKEKEAKEQMVKEIEKAAGKASIDFEDETKRKPKLREILCGCCNRRRRVSDVSSDVTSSPANTGCCGKRQQAVERRDSILSDREPTGCCNSRLCNWVRGACRRRSEAPSTSRRPSMFSKNKSLSPTLPTEDTRPKLDPSLIEHTSVMRAAIPALPIVLAYFCLVCNVLVPGLGTVLSGMFCLCFGVPRFGVHDGAKHRIGSFIINTLVGCGQLFTVLFCLVGWGWAIWWGVIMLRIARKYRKLKSDEAAAAAAAEEENAPSPPPVTANNHAAPPPAQA